MDVLLVRHAKSDYDWQKWPTDNVRPLSKIGVNRQHKVAQGMVKFGLIYDAVWVSPYVRAQETLQIIQSYQEKYIEPKIVNELRVAGDPEKVLSLLFEQNKDTPNQRLLLVGHNPNMTNLLELIINDGSYIEMRTSDLAHCKITDNHSELIKFYSRNDLMVDG